MWDASGRQALEVVLILPPRRLSWRPSTGCGRGQAQSPTQGETVRRLALLVLGPLIVAGSGCGTVCNFFHGESSGPKYVYGGVQMDCQLAAEHLKDRPAQGISLVLFALLDLPLSLLGDTLTLPLTLSDQLHDLTADRPNAVPQPVVPVTTPACLNPPSAPSVRPQ